MAARSSPCYSREREQSGKTRHMMGMDECGRNKKCTARFVTAKYLATVVVSVSSRGIGVGNEFRSVVCTSTRVCVYKMHP